jgi:hypothetical protein
LGKVILLKKAIKGHLWGNRKCIGIEGNLFTVRVLMPLSRAPKAMALVKFEPWRLF